MPPRSSRADFGFTLIELLVVTPVRKFLRNFKRGRSPSARSAFTLIELLVVIAIIAILAVVVILTLNPQEQIKQARDSNRLSDLATLTKALSLYQSDYGGTLGNASTVYVSVPAVNSNCSDLGLPALPAGWSYACASTSTYRKIDGTGWIPVNFQNVSFGSPLGTLPVDPVNTTTTQNYYTYVIGGTGNNQYEVSTLMESQRYATEEATDGGSDPASYEVGSNLAIAPFTHGLVGYWKFDEGSGIYAADSSGFNDTATFAGPDSHWGSGKNGNAGYFGGSDYASATTPVTQLPKGYTMMAWFKPTVLAVGDNIIASLGLPYISFHASGNQAFTSANISGTQRTISGSTVISTGNWYLIAGTYDNQTLAVYLNGNLENSAVYPGTLSNPNVSFCMGAHVCNSYWTYGYLDDMRLYNRALSAAEIQAIYNATK